jgi:3-hydroxyacyl-[acyl-carrier-protein] dehydratase
MTHKIDLHIAHDHPAFAGHFPGLPITPGVVLLDEAIHAIAQHAQMDLHGCTINSVKFLKPVGPDASLTVEYDVRANGNIHFDVKENQHTMVTGVFSA